MTNQTIIRLYNVLNDAQDLIDEHFALKGLHRYQAETAEDKLLDAVAVELWTCAMSLGAKTGVCCEHFVDPYLCGDCEWDRMSDEERAAEDAWIAQEERLFAEAMEAPGLF